MDKVSVSLQELIFKDSPVKYKCIIFLTTDLQYKVFRHNPIITLSDLEKLYEKHITRQNRFVIFDPYLTLQLIKTEVVVHLAKNMPDLSEPILSYKVTGINQIQYCTYKDFLKTALLRLLNKETFKIDAEGPNGNVIRFASEVTKDQLSLHVTFPITVAVWDEISTEDTQWRKEFADYYA